MDGEREVFSVPSSFHRNFKYTCTYKIVKGPPTLSADEVDVINEFIDSKNFIRLRMYILFS